MSEVIQKATSIPASYGDGAAEYETVREGGAGIIDLSSRGRILVSGSEAVQFLNGLITNDMKTLQENRWMAAAFPNVQGRLIANVKVLRVVRESESETDVNFSPTFLIDTEPVTHERVLKTIERFTLAGDFRVKDISHETAHLTVQGQKAADVIRMVLGGEVADLPKDGASRTMWQNADVMLIRSTHTGEDGFDLIVNSEHASGLWDSLVEAGARPVGYDALERLRIEAGIPRYGLDMDESNVVTETGLDDAVNYTKGCYVGQEIIARIKYRGHVAKKLSGLAFSEPVEVDAGAIIKSTDDKDIGRLTSVTYSPQLGQTVALGYLKYDYLAAGTEVNIATASGDHRATVVQLPFVQAKF